MLELITHICYNKVVANDEGVQKMDYTIKDDLMVIKELTEDTWADLAKKIEVEEYTLFRWLDGSVMPSEKNLEKIYAVAFKEGIRLNKIYEQLYKEDYSDEKSVVLLHGAKTEIKGKLSLDYSKDSNDFGKGFYCGESLEQSAMFVAGYPKSSLYVVRFNKDKLKEARFSVNQDWMLTIAYFRGKLKDYENHLIIRTLIERLKKVDYIIAPIADNKMFQIIDSFIDGEITDEQCRHCLSATNLGFQYVFITEKALENIEILHRGYLAKQEKEFYLDNRAQESKIGEDKVKIARREYRGKGLYIDDILK